MPSGDTSIDKRLNRTDRYIHPAVMPRIAVVRNEINPSFEYHCDALAASIPEAVEVDYVAGESPSLDAVDAVVLTGSTAGVYEAGAHPWIERQEALIRELVDREIPTLGVCFGHQIANRALGGTVEHVGTTSKLVEASFVDDPLFEGVSPIVPAVHTDHVTEPAAELRVIASAPHNEAFATRHRSAPLWTVQFHPELDEELLDYIRDDYGWTETGRSFSDVNHARVFENFRGIALESSVPSA